MEWKSVATQQDIEELMSFYHGFHDSCIAGLSYQSGTFVDENRAIYFGELDTCTVTVLFHSQWAPNIELRFGGVRRIHIVGIQDNYFSDILCAFLGFYDNIAPNKHRFEKGSNNYIVWSDNESFDVDHIKDALQEPEDTYIIATSLKWRTV